MIAAWGLFVVAALGPPVVAAVVGRRRGAWLGLAAAVVLGVAGAIGLESATAAEIERRRVAFRATARSVDWGALDASERTAVRARIDDFMGHGHLLHGLRTSAPFIASGLTLGFFGWRRYRGWLDKSLDG